MRASPALQQTSIPHFPGRPEARSRRQHRLPRLLGSGGQVRRGRGRKSFGPKAQHFAQRRAQPWHILDYPVFGPKAQQFIQRRRAPGVAGSALVQRPPHDPFFLFLVTSGPTGQKFIFNPTRTVRQSRCRASYRCCGIPPETSSPDGVPPGRQCRR